MSTNRSKAKVITDIKKNRLYIVFGCDVKKNDVERIYMDVRFGVADLTPGFDVINNLSNATIGHLSGAPTFKKIAEYLIAHKVGRVIRVMGGTSSIFRQVTKLSATINGYQPEYTETVEEAEQLLEKSE